MLGLLLGLLSQPPGLGLGFLPRHLIGLHPCLGLGLLPCLLLVLLPGLGQGSLPRHDVANGLLSHPPLSLIHGILLGLHLGLGTGNHANALLTLLASGRAAARAAARRIAWDPAPVQARAMPMCYTVASLSEPGMMRDCVLHHILLLSLLPALLRHGAAKDRRQGAVGARRALEQLVCVGTRALQGGRRPREGRGAREGREACARRRDAAGPLVVSALKKRVLLARGRAAKQVREHRGFCEATRGTPKITTSRSAED